MYHSFLIHSSADGHLGCFHVLAMINSAAMNIGVHVNTQFFQTIGSCTMLKAIPLNEGKTGFTFVSLHSKFTHFHI